ncbi:MAG: NAD(P)H-hydrate epimerase, partial [Pseudomonadota bacterium]
MTEVLTAAQMRAIEQEAIDSGAVTGLELMERAGRGVVEAIFEEWPELAQTSHKAVVLCGPGNNGGDGFVVARVLKDWGWDVEVFLYGDPAKLPPDARANYERWNFLAVTRPLEKDVDYCPDGTNLVVDALFGTGLSRPVEFSTDAEGCSIPDKPLGEVLRHLCDCVEAGRGMPLNDRYHWPPVVAVDIPSGLSSDSGHLVCGPNPSTAQGSRAWSAIADLTVTFHQPKIGHHLSLGPIDCGSLCVKSIGLEGCPRPRVGEKPPPGGAVGDCPAVPPSGRVRLIENASSELSKGGDTHKYTHGHALILSGGSGSTGAARLAARGALRIGAGLVTLGVPPAAQQEVACQITSIMLARVEDGAGLTETLKDERLNALCLGPGFGTGERERALILAALEARRPTVLDADALTDLFFDEADALFGKLHDQCVLTPHAGEFARMFPDIADKLNTIPTKGPAYSKIDATRDAAARAGCTVLFKGADTVIA